MLITKARGRYICLNIIINCFVLDNINFWFILKCMKVTQQIINALVNQHGLTLEEIAAKMKANYNTVYTWSRGIRNANTWALEKLNRILRGYERRKK